MGERGGAYNKEVGRARKGTRKTTRRKRTWYDVWTVLHVRRNLQLKIERGSSALHYSLILNTNQTLIAGDIWVIAKGTKKTYGRIFQGKTCDA